MKITKSTAAYIAAILAVLLLCGAVSRYLIQLTLVQGDSMEPAYHNRQFIVLSKFRESYDRGEVILFDCESLGCTLAYNFDGGKSAVMVWDGDTTVNTPAGGGRNVTDILYIAKE